MSFPRSLETSALAILSLAVPLAVATAGCGSVHETPSDCTAPCAGDPVDDFGQTQGGTTGRWQYLADTRSTSGADYAELTWGLIRGEPGWVGGVGASPPGILSCADNSSAAGCAGLETSLLFYPGTDQDPALAFVAQADGTYALTGKVRAATGDPEGLPERFTISRNSRHDLIDSRVHVTAPIADDFSAEVELLAGDRLILSFPGGSNAVPVAFDYHLTLVANGASAFPGSCQMAVTFDGSDAFADPCRNPIENLNDGIGPAGMSSNAASVTTALGNARTLAEGQFLRASGGPLDRSGDFTIQFWAKLVEPQQFGSTVYADWNNAVEGGINLGFGDTQDVFLCSMYMAAQESCVQGSRPLDAAWHFYRVTRSTSEAQIELCIDGRTVTSDPNVGTADMTGDQPPHLGRNVDYNPAYFNGTIDDVRAFKRALPCPTP